MALEYLAAFCISVRTALLQNQGTIENSSERMLQVGLSGANTWLVLLLTKLHGLIGQILFGIKKVQMLWDPGCCELISYCFITATLGQAKFQGEENVMDVNPFVIRLRGLDKQWVGLASSTNGQAATTKGDGTYYEQRQ